MSVMTPEIGADLELLTWGNTHLRVHVSTAPDDAPRLLGLSLPGDPAPAVRRSALPVVELSVVDEGRVGTSGKRHVDGAVSHRLRLVGQEQGDGPVPGATSGPGTRPGPGTTASTQGPWWTLQMRDHLSGIEATTTLSLPGDGATLRVETTVTSTLRTVVLEHVSSLVLGGLASGEEWEDHLLWQAANPWSGEFRWHRSTLGGHGLVDVGMSRFAQVGSKNRVALTSVGSWSTSEHLPMGALENPTTGRVLAWQVESSSGWHWEVADRYDDLYVLASGPTGLEHGWSATLEPGQSFTAVPAAVTLVAGGDLRAAPASTGVPTSTRVGEDGSATRVGAALTDYRRAVRRPHEDHHGLPVVYNDFLNGLMSDPTTDRVLPLVEAAADLGAEIYCMDAGWYDDEGGGWWDSVGEWAPSTTRFPGGGLGAVMDEVRRAGMRPGLWLEPEVVGVRSPLARTLPPEAFFRRHGRRVTEWGRHQLDLRHPAGREHLDEVVDRLVGELELGYLKLDYNVDTGAGTESPGQSGHGLGLLDHGRAMLDWVSAVMDRHPGLVVEGCAAGGSRTDGASGAVFPVQSLTDQQDMLLVPPIAAAAAMAITPEQAGVWASLDGSMDPETLTFVLASAMTSRIHLAGRIDTLDAAQRHQVRSALATYTQIRSAIPRSSPVWPLGLPQWRDDLVVSGLRDQRETFLVVHRRGGESSVSIPLAGVSAGARVETLLGATDRAELDADSAVLGAEDVVLRADGPVTRLDLTLPAAPSARVLRITDV